LNAEHPVNDVFDRILEVRPSHDVWRGMPGGRESRDCSHNQSDADGAEERSRRRRRNLSRARDSGRGEQRRAENEMEEILHGSNQRNGVFVGEKNVITELR
jgi:hypothetical protein